MAYKIEIEKDVCIACGACVATCPEHFEMNEEENHAQPKQSSVEELGCAQEAADNCPVECIHIKKI
jgi:ferredoxin